MGFSKPDADRLIVVLSDIEMGAGGLVDDFPHTEFLAELIASYERRRFRDVAIDLVFNGDTFDFLKTSVSGAYPTHIDAALALAKLSRIAARHHRFFEALAHFLARENRRAHFVVGNHDFELLYPEVQGEIIRLIGRPEQVLFPGVSLDIGDVHIEHGSQGDPLFAIDVAQPFVEVGGRKILNLPWGAVGLLEVAMPMHPELYHLERVKPRSVLFELMPEAKELLLKKARRYWLRDYWRELMRGADPMKRITWSMIKEVVYRFSKEDADVSMGDHYQRALQDGDRHRLIVVGHRHEAHWWTHGDRKLLTTGCFREEYMIRNGGREHVQLPKIYAEVHMKDDRVRRSQLVELEGPPPPPGYVPETLQEVLPAVRGLLERENDQRADEGRTAEIDRKVA
jgi:UDP-2,3-diacylglucosamine pyrophosphatase LpxH